MTTVTLCLLLTMCAIDPLSAGDHQRSVQVDGLTRKYLVHVPKSFHPDRPVPVVLIYHGGGSNAEQMVRFCGLNDKAEEAGFVAVYPSGSGRLPRLLTFNGGNCCGYALQQKINDVEFARLLLDDLETVVNIDPHRVFATGMSNGAIMAYLLASELSDRIAAIAPVGGPMGTETCQPKRPVPVMHFHGTNDDFAPYQGGVGTRSLTGTNFYSVEHSIKSWVAANGCPDQPTEENIPDQAGDGTTATIATYGPGRDDAEVVLITIHGGGHTWPGREPGLKMLGKSTKNISANDRMWEFFEKHSAKKLPGE